MTGLIGDGTGDGEIVVMVKPLWLITTGLISTSPVMMIVPVRSLMGTRASGGNIGTGNRCTRLMKLSGRSSSLLGIVTTTFFGSTATANVSPTSLSPASLM